MTTNVTEIIVQADKYQVSKVATLLVAQLHAAVAICIHDDTQGVGGLLHLRYTVGGHARPVDLTDNTLSSDLLLLDRFCKELRAVGARKTTWRVRIVGHVPVVTGMAVPAATLSDLLRAYFQDSRLPVDCRELEQAEDITVRFESREGKLWVK